MSKKRTRSPQCNVAWMVFGLFLLPLPSKAQTPNSEVQVRCTQEANLGFLKIVENELGATHRSFRADGEARLAAIYYPINRAEALRLWKEAFFSVTGLKNNTIGVGGAKDGGRSKEVDSSSSIKLAAYTKATEATPASVEARVIRDLLRFDQKEKAIEFFLVLGKQETPAPADDVIIQPVLIQRDFELPTALMEIPVALWKTGTDSEQSYEYFTQIVDEFDAFPYLAAGSYIRLKPAPPGHVHRVAQALLRHFDRQELDARDMGSTRVALEQFTRLLSDFGEDDAKEGAHLVVAKLNRLKDAGWSPNTHSFQQGLCGYLTEGSTEKNGLCGAQEVASNPAVDSSFLPPEVKKIMEALKTRSEALSLAGTDLVKAESIVMGIDDPLARADLLADLAAVVWNREKGRADAAEAFKMAVDILAAVKVDKKSEYLESVLHLSLVASRYSKADFSRVVQLGLVVMGRDSLIPEADFEDLAYIHNGVSLLGFWAQIDSENALKRIKGIPDPKVRVLALLAAAEAGSLGISQPNEQRLTQDSNGKTEKPCASVPHSGRSGHNE
jgi:hypothetical protein